MGINEDKAELDQGSTLVLTLKILEILTMNRNKVSLNNLYTRDVGSCRRGAWWSYPIKTMSQVTGTPHFARLWFPWRDKVSAFSSGTGQAQCVRHPSLTRMYSVTAQSHLRPASRIFEFCESWRREMRMSVNMHGLATFKFVNQMSLCLFRLRQNVTASEFPIKALCQILLFQTGLKWP